MPTPFQCDNCKSAFGTTNGEWLKLEIKGLEATVYKGIEFKCACGFIVKWREKRKQLKNKRK